MLFSTDVCVMTVLISVDLMNLVHTVSTNVCSHSDEAAGNPERFLILTQSLSAYLRLMLEKTECCA